MVVFNYYPHSLWSAAVNLGQGHRMAPDGTGQVVRLWDLHWCPGRRRDPRPGLGSRSRAH